VEARKPSVFKINKENVIIDLSIIKELEVPNKKNRHEISMPRVVNTSNNNISRNTLLLAHTSENITTQTDNSSLII
jgi:hypothetical protein